MILIQLNSSRGLAQLPGSVIKRLLGVFVATLLGACVSGQALAANTATLLIEAFNPSGNALNVSDFAQQATYVASPKFSIGQNYGIFPMGQLPATAQVGSAPGPVTQGSRQFVSFAIPSNQAVYFTSLWKADGIGTVYMRADNGGQGYILADNQTRELQLPYEFALSEYAVASRLAASAPAVVSATSTSNLQQAASLVQAATLAPSNAARAVAAYQALAIIMLLKEQLIIEISNAAISHTAHRTDFTLNYEGFGSWTDSRFVPNYNQAKAAGFRFVYTQIDWNVISPSPGVYNFSSLDFQVDRAIALGFRVSFSVNHSLGMMPAWVGNLSFEELKILYYQNAFAVVQRYKDKVTSIYPMAEPELNTKGHTLAQIAELTRRSFEGARAAASAMPFGLYMSAAAYVGYIVNPVPNGEYFSSLDVLHYLTQNGIRPDFLGLQMQYATVFAPVDLQRQSELLQAYASATLLPIYIGETGYSSKSEDYGIAAQFYWHGGLTQQAQTQWADGLLRISYSNSSIKGLYWVHIDPDDNDYNSDFLTSLIGASLFRADGAKKKAYTAFQDFASQFMSGSSGSLVSIEATGGAGQSATVNTVFSSALQATVRDSLGNAVPNAEVTFTVPSSGASGMFPGPALTATVVTNSAGVAVAPVLTATSTDGQFQVAATVAGAPAAAFFTLSNAACAYALSSAATSAPAIGGTGFGVTVATTAGCAWTSTSDSGFLLITSGGAGTGSGTVQYMVLANAGAQRLGNLTIAGINFTVEQQAASIPGLTFAGSMAQIASAGTWKTTFDFINLGVVAAQVRISFFGDGGSSLPLPLTFQQSPPAAGPLLASSFDRLLSPGASLVIESTGPDAQPTSVGWAQLMTNGNISGFALFSNPFYHWDAVVPLESRNAASYLLAFDNTGGLVTGLAIANLGNLAANIPVIVRNSSGVQIGSFNLPVPAMGHTSFMLKDNYPITSDQRGTIEFQTPPGGRISVLGLRANGPSVTTLPVLANVGTTGGSITHTLFNGEWTAGYTLVNTGAATASATLNFFAEDGTGLNVPLSLPQTGELVTGTSITKIIPARGSLLIETVGQATQPVVVGSARLTTTGNISGFGIFKWLPFGQEASVSLESRNPAAYVLAFDNTNGLATGLAVAEVSGTAAAAIPVIVRDDAGVSLTGTTFINLPVNGHTSFMLSGAFPATVGKRGTVEFQTPPGRRISVIGLRATPTGNVTTIPVLAK